MPPLSFGGKAPLRPEGAPCGTQLQGPGQGHKVKGTDGCQRLLYSDDGARGSGEGSRCWAQARRHAGRCLRRQEQGRATGPAAKKTAAEPPPEDEPRALSGFGGWNGEAALYLRRLAAPYLPAAQQGCGKGLGVLVSHGHAG